ncbi:defender against death DAD protein [Durotheca rogersii]|uniref:defender against death DAD protein n=1 Tax=Durotheca rogersii TaxID=419775 RepID=UPI002220C187|nr:defender against death DAD protein [Durotheca rogersii]KAI5866964.1 defender against death DAD protein [Durotheca rogersii]
MPPKKPASAAATASASAASTTASTPTSAAAPTAPPTTGSSGKEKWLYTDLYNTYRDNTPQRTKLVDLFMIFLVIVGALQFVYCFVGGNYPFNAFLSGFSATVGQFVLTASLRVQTAESNKDQFPSVSPERAFADYVVGSLILHFFCVNFIN